MSGVYFIKRNGYKNIYKVGFSTCLKSRLISYNTIFLEEDCLKYYKIITSENYKSIGELRYLENLCHNIWNNFRKGRKELFEIDDFKQEFNKLVNLLSDNNIDVLVHDKIPRFYCNPEETKIDYSYQNSKIKLVEEFFKINNEGMLVYPPGWGKTFISGKIMKNYRNVVIFVPQILIANEFAKMCVILKLDFDVEIINSDYTSGEKMEELKDGQIKIITYQSHSKCMDKLKNVDLVVYDEAHHTCAEKYCETLKLKSTKKLFLTATPKIVDEFDIKIPIIDRESIRDSIDKGILCDYKVMVYNNCSLLDMTKDLINKHNRKHLIIFFNRVERSTEFCKILTKCGINSFNLHGGCTRYKKNKILAKFSETGGVKIICNVNMISEGVSLPCADCIIFAEPRESSIGVIQNLGRILRKCDGKNISLVCLPPNMTDIISMINIIYHHDSKFQNKNDIGMFIGNKECTDLIKEKVRLIEINKTGGLWEYKYLLCFEYEKKHGLIKGMTWKYLGENIGKWIARQRSNFKKDKIDDMKLKMLQNLKTWNNWIKTYDPNKPKIVRKDFMSTFKLCLEYEKNTSNIIIATTVYKTENLGDWINRIRNNTVDTNKLDLLKTLKSWTNTFEHYWMKNYKLCIEKEKESEDRIMQKKNNMYKDENIGKWLSSQKCKHYNGNITKKELSLLCKLFSWNYLIEHSEDVVWTKKFNLYLEAKKKYGHIKQNFHYKGKPVGMWFHNQKKKLKPTNIEKTKSEKNKKKKYKQLEIFKSHGWM